MSSLISDMGLRSAEGGVGPADERPLSDDERKVVTRLLSDPFSFPQSFKTWLIAFLEGSDLSLPMASVVGLSTILGVQGGGSSGVFGILPAGLLFPYGGAVAPDGTVMCDGAAYPRVGQYNRLFKAIGTSWGAGDGSTTFNVPDARNRSLFGFGPGYPFGTNEGLTVALRGPKHHHGLNNHSHGMSHTHTLNGHSHGMSHTHLIPLSGGYTETQFQSGGTRAAVFQTDGANTGGPSFATTSGSSENTSGPSFATTSGSTADTTGGGSTDAPAYLACGVIINY